MTRETAMKAADILHTIEVLAYAHDRFEKADHISITVGLGGNRMMELDIYPDRGTENKRYLRYIMDGLSDEIQSLQEELARL